MIHPYTPERWILSLAARVKDANKRADLFIVAGILTIEEVRALWQRCEGLCMACQQCLAVELDHILPLWQGGDNAIKNLQWLCRPCHKQKTKKEFSGWNMCTHIPRYAIRPGTQLTLPGMPHKPYPTIWEQLTTARK